MNTHGRRFWLVAVGWAIALSAIWVQHASSSTSVVVAGAATPAPLAAMFSQWSFQTTPVCSGFELAGGLPFFDPLPAAGTPLCYQNCEFSWVRCPGTPLGYGITLHRARAIVGPTPPGGGTCPGADCLNAFTFPPCPAGTICTSTMTAVLSGGSASGLAPEAQNDTTFARDSINANIVRSGNTITVNNFSGELRNNLGTLAGERTAQSIFILAVYPDSNTYLADVDHTGQGANFYGKVSVKRTPTSSVIDPKNGFSAADWVLSTSANGNVATPAGGLSKAVIVPNGANAVVMLFADPRLGSEAVPGAPPIAAALMSLLLATAGVWFINARYRPRVA